MTSKGVRKGKISRVGKESSINFLGQTMSSKGPSERDWPPLDITKDTPGQLLATTVQSFTHL